MRERAGPDKERQLQGCRDASECATGCGGEAVVEEYHCRGRGKWCWGSGVGEGLKAAICLGAGICCLAAVDRGCAELPLV